MRRSLDFLYDAWIILWATTAALFRNVAGHWALAAFSLVAAFGVWIAIQDVDNPRVQGEAPRAGGIQVEAVNVPANCIVDELPTVVVDVEAREGELENLLPGDFEAEVDMSGASCETDTQVERPVRVTIDRNSVDILDVLPPQITVSLTKASSRDVPVTIRLLSEPPADLRVRGNPEVEPAVVRVTGRADLVDNVDSVELDVNLSGARDETFVVEGDLVARTETGNDQQVTITPRRATATYTLERVLSRRTIGIQPSIVGTPAPGFAVRNITIEPPVIQITGSREIVDNLSEEILTEPYDVTGARAGATITRTIQLPANVISDTTTAVVTVEIVPLQCGDAAGACGGTTLSLSIELTDIPAGLQPAPGILTALVGVSGPIAQVSELKVGDLKATISLAGASAGTDEYDVTVAAPAGIRIESVVPVSITLTATGGSP